MDFIMVYLIIVNNWVNVTVKSSGMLHGIVMNAAGYPKY